LGSVKVSVYTVLGRGGPSTSWGALEVRGIGHRGSRSKEADDVRRRVPRGAARIVWEMGKPIAQLARSLGVKPGKLGIAVECDVLKAIDGLAGQGADAVSLAAFNADQRTSYEVPNVATCRLDVSKSWFDEWRDQPPTPAQKRPTQARCSGDEDINRLSRHVRLTENIGSREFLALVSCRVCSRDVAARTCDCASQRRPRDGVRAAGMVSRAVMVSSRSSAVRGKRRCQYGGDDQ
jgi:hypothetical protein